MLWLIIDLGRYSPIWVVSHWTSGPLLYKKIASCTSHRQQASKQCSSLASAPGPASWFLPWVSVLLFLPDGLWLGPVIINPLLPRFLRSWYFIIRYRTKTVELIFWVTICHGFWVWIDSFNYFSSQWFRL